MIRTITVECDVKGTKKRVEFYTFSTLEFYLGWTTSYMKKLEDLKRFPITPYVKKTNHKPGAKFEGFVRLYTKQQIIDLVELVEVYCPCRPRSRDLLVKEKYKYEMLEYMNKVQELQKKWEEEDYLALEDEAPAKYKKEYKWRKNQT